MTRGSLGWLVINNQYLLRLVRVHQQIVLHVDFSNINILSIYNICHWYIDTVSSFLLLRLVSSVFATVFVGIWRQHTILNHLDVLSSLFPNSSIFSFSAHRFWPYPSTLPWTQSLQSTEGLVLVIEMRISFDYHNGRRWTMLYDAPYVANDIR